MSLFAYAVGLLATLFVMVTFEAAQPALLYIVPAVAVASFGTAVLLGDVRGLLKYSDDAAAASGTAAEPAAGGGSGDAVEKKTM